MFLCLSVRDGSVDGVSRPYTARTDGRTVRGGDAFGHGYISIRRPVKGLMLLFNLLQIIHRNLVVQLYCIRAGLGCQTNANGMRMCVAWKNCCLSSDYICNFPYRDSCWTGCESLKSRRNGFKINIQHLFTFLLHISFCIMFHKNIILIQN